MFTESAALYDTIYGSFKDYAAEVERIATLLRAAHPDAHMILDVACGTGEHARRLAETYGYAVDGLDLDAALLEIARAKHPAGTFLQGDMSDFALGRRYDVVTCLFSSIGYLATIDRVTRALWCFREHLAPGGIVVVEPWFTPEVLDDGHVSTVRAEAGALHVERTAHTSIVGRLSRIRFDYRIEDASGVRTVTEQHELGLFTTQEMLAAFADAGLEAEHDPVGLIGRGLYVARKN
jgi:SAM-dependent methyltransferase